MPRSVPRLAVSVVAVVAMASLTAGARQARGSLTAPVRGLWVPRTAMASPASIAAVVQSALDGGFNTLLVQVRGRGEAFYRSAIEPRATDLDRQPADFDPLQTTITQARQAGLGVHAWVNVNLVASGTTLPRSREHVANLHPDWLMVPKALAQTLSKTSVWSPAYLGTLARWTRTSSEQVEGMYVSPVTPASRAYTTSVLAELAARYALDGIHLDYIRYPSAAFDFSPAALASFRETIAGSVTRAERERLDRNALVQPTVWADAWPAEWAAFHRERLNLLVAAVSKAIHEARPGLLLSAAVVGVAADAREQRYQDWMAWAKAGRIDVVCPMLYTLSVEQFGAVTADIHASLGGVPYWAGIGAYRLPVDATIERVRLARRANAVGVLLFSYGQLAEGTSAASVTLAALRAVLLESTNGSGGVSR